MVKSEFLFRGEVFEGGGEIEVLGAGSFFGDAAVGDAGVGGGEVEVEEAEEVPLIVGEEGVRVGVVGVDVGDFGAFEFVERVADVEAEFEHFVAVTVAGEEEDAADFLVADEGEDFVALGGVALPGVSSFFVSMFGPKSR